MSTAAVVVKKSVVRKPETRQQVLARTIAQSNALVENHPIGVYLEQTDSPQGKATIVVMVTGMLIELQLDEPGTPMWRHRRYIGSVLDMAVDQAERSRLGKELLRPGSSESDGPPEQEVEAYAILVAGIARTIFNERLVED